MCKGGGGGGGGLRVPANARRGMSHGAGAGGVHRMKLYKERPGESTRLSHRLSGRVSCLRDMVREVGGCRAIRGALKYGVQSVIVCAECCHLVYIYSV